MQESFESQHQTVAPLFALRNYSNIRAKGLMSLLFQDNSLGSISGGSITQSADLDRSGSSLEETEKLSAGTLCFLF
jgi:hypothetical protein